MSARERTLQLIRARRALTAGRPRRPRMPRQRQPDGIRLEYAKAILRYLARARQMLEARVYPRVRLQLEAVRLDARSINDDIDDVSEAFFKTVLRPAEIEDLAHDVAGKTSSFQKEELGRQLNASVGVDVFAAEPGLSARAQEFIGENVALIKSVPNKLFDDIEKTVMRAMAEGKRWEVLAKELEQRHSVAESSARLIARDQVGKFFGELNRVRQTALGITHYIWQTSNDARVRDEHAALQGQRFAWDDPPAEGQPGHAINCRCYPEPDMSSLLEGL